MHRSFRRLVGVLVAPVVGVTALALAPAASAAGAVPALVRQQDLVEPSGTTGQASLAFAADGAHVVAAGAGDLAQATFPVSDVGLGGDVDYAWTGSQTEPVIRYDVDLDGDGQPDFQLLGQHRYGDDVWVDETYQVTDPTVSLQQIEAAAPCRGARPQGQTSASCRVAHGGRYHGDLGDWGGDLGYPIVTDLGFVAQGPGVDGVLTSILLGDNAFRFTDQPREHPQVYANVRESVVPAGGTYTVYGSVVGSQPLQGLPLVTLQIKPVHTRTWATVRTGGSHTQNFTGVFAAPSTPGRYLLRVIEERTDYYLRTSSRIVRLTVTPTSPEVRASSSVRPGAERPAPGR